MTAPSDDALSRDVELIRAMGYNGARKHQKLEDSRCLYWADKLGLMVWSQLPGANWLGDCEKRSLMCDLPETIRWDDNHPSLIPGMPLNESWSEPFIQTQQMARQLADAPKGFGLENVRKRLDL